MTYQPTYDAARAVDDIKAHARVVEQNGDLDAVLWWLSRLDDLRKSFDRIQANPTHPLDETIVEAILPERAHRDGDTQPLPVGNDLPIMHEVVIDELRRRLEVGIRRYGHPLQPFNGRDAVQDAFEEVLDLSVYLAQLRYEMAAYHEVLAAALPYVTERECPHVDYTEAGCETCLGDSAACPRQQLVVKIMALIGVNHG